MEPSTPNIFSKLKLEYSTHRDTITSRTNVINVTDFVLIEPSANILIGKVSVFDHRGAGRQNESNSSKFTFCLLSQE